MFNQVVLIGRLTEKPELNHTSSGTPVANFTLAVERENSSSNNCNKNMNSADFIPIVAWERKAEIAAKYLDKGRLVAINGRLKLEQNKTEQFTYTNPKVTAYNIQFLDSNSQNASDKRENSNGIPQNEKQNTQANTPEKSNSIGSDDLDVEVPF